VARATKIGNEIIIARSWKRRCDEFSRLLIDEHLPVPATPTKGYERTLRSVQEDDASHSRWVSRSEMVRHTPVDFHFVRDLICTLKEPSCNWRFKHIFNSIKQSGNNGDLISMGAEV
jgi:hypothetical protein